MRRERIEHFETVRLRKGGERIEVSRTISSVKGQRSTHRIVGAAKIARDIIQQNKMEPAARADDFFK